MKTALPASVEIREIPLSLLKPTANNPRRLRPDDPALVQIADSIRARGQLQNGVARPHPTEKGVFELLAGARRWWGCQMAGLETMRVAVMDLDDRAALEVTVIENLQRAVLSPMEEASGIRMLVKSGATPAEIAAKIGQSWSWVIRRDRLNDLSPAWVKELDNPESRFSHFTASHLERIARYTHDRQDRLLSELQRSMYGLPRSVSQLDAALADYQAKLSSALWDLADAALLPKAGPCATCMKRASCQPGLFGDVEVTDAKHDQCLDPSCFRRKEKAWLLRKEAELRGEHKDLVLIKRGYDERGLAGSLGEYDVDMAKKGDKGARPALVTAGPGKGRITYVKLRSGAKQQPTVAKTPEQVAAEKRAKDAAAADRRKASALGRALKAAAMPKAFDARLAIAILLEAGWLRADRFHSLQRVAQRPLIDLLRVAWDHLRKQVAAELCDDWKHAPQPKAMKAIAELIGHKLDAAEEKPVKPKAASQQ